MEDTQSTSNDDTDSSSCNICIGNNFYRHHYLSSDTENYEEDYNEHKINDTLLPSRSYGTFSLDYDQIWACSVCTFENSSISFACEMCQNIRCSNLQWACLRCTLVQSNQNRRCELCNSPHDGYIDMLSKSPPLIHQLSDTIANNLLGQISRNEITEQVFYCKVCLENVVVSKKVNLCCPHEYCKNCMEQYLSVQIREARVLNVTCPGIDDITGTSCTAPFSKRDIKELVDQKTWHQYERFVKLKTDNSYVECPFCNQLQKGNKFKLQMICERKECASEFCFLHSNAHVGMSCMEYKKKNSRDIQK